MLKNRMLEMLDTCRALLRKAGLEGSFVIENQSVSTIRVARGFPHQPSVASEYYATLLLTDSARRAIIVSTTFTNKRDIENTIKKAKALLPDIPENPFLPDMLNQPAELPEAKLFEWDEETALHNSGRFVSPIRKAMRDAEKMELAASARFYTCSIETAVGNTLNLARYHRQTFAACELVIIGEAGTSLDRVSAFAARGGHCLNQIPYDEIIEEALGNASMQKALPMFDPFGPYGSKKSFDTILKPEALATWLWWLSIYGFNAISVYNETGLLTGKFGEQVMPSDININDDWTYEGMIPMPFDTDGMTRQRVPIIEKGVAAGVVCDGYLNKISGLPRTGHASIRYGRFSRPLHLVFEVEGNNKANVDEIIRTCERPTILVTYFNYPSMPETREGVFTATTRHGTFMAEDGKIKYTVPALRFLEKSLSAFSRITMSTRPVIVIDQDQYEGGEMSSFAVPAIKIRDFNFIGSVS